MRGGGAVNEVKGINRVAYDITSPVWAKDGHGFTFEYNQRGHQVYRVLEADAQTGKVLENAAEGAHPD